MNIEYRVSWESLFLTELELICFCSYKHINQHVGLLHETRADFNKLTCFTVPKAAFNNVFYKPLLKITELNPTD